VISATISFHRSAFAGVFRAWALSLLAMVAICTSGRASVVDVASSTTGWTAIQYANSSPDPSNDQQTGSSEGDIVGNAAHPSVYTTFGDGNTSSLTDGTLAFRVRVGADASPAGFKAALFVGIDANHDGALDLFIGVNNSGSADSVAIWNPGAGLNISPNTTTIVSTPLVSYTPTAANYNWTVVSSTIDPTVGAATDLDGGGKPDYFLTFSVPFADVVAQLSFKGISGVDQNSAFSYVISTATQANSLNQDLNGVDKNYDPAAIWSALGVVSNQMTPAGLPVVPETKTVLSVCVAIFVILSHDQFSRRRRRRQRAGLST
jgi:hypothetical protein